VLPTATRRAEAAGLRHTELSDNGRTWIMPGSRYKNGRDTLIPLSRAAQRIIAAQPPLGDFVFSATGERALGGFGKRKDDFDKASKVTGWTIHDLRRTARTLLSRAGISADIGERALGHAIIGIRSTYDRHEYEAEKRHAFEALAAQIERIVQPRAAGVADMAEARAKRRQRWCMRLIPCGTPARTPSRGRARLSRASGCPSRRTPGSASRPPCWT